MSEQGDISTYDDDNEYDMLSELNYYLTNELDGFKEEDENGYIFVNVIEMFEYMLTNNYYHDSTFYIDKQTIENELNGVENNEDLNDVNNKLISAISKLYNATTVKVDENDDSRHDHKMTFNEKEEPKTKLNPACSSDNYHMICKSNIMMANASVYSLIFEKILAILKNGKIKSRLDDFALTADYDQDVYNFINVINLFIIRPITVYSNIKNVMSVVCNKIMLTFADYPSVFSQYLTTLNKYITNSRDTKNIGRDAKIINNITFEAPNTRNNIKSYNIPVLVLNTFDQSIDDVLDQYQTLGMNNIEIIGGNEE